jgi:hypothetical protein
MQACAERFGAQREGNEMDMKFKGREAWRKNGDLEVYDASGKFDTPTLLTVHEYRTKRGRQVLKLIKAAPLLLDALEDLVNDDGMDEMHTANCLNAARAAIAAATN